MIENLSPLISYRGHNAVSRNLGVFLGMYPNRNYNEVRFHSINIEHIHFTYRALDGRTGCAEKGFPLPFPVAMADLNIYLAPGSDLRAISHRSRVYEGVDFILSPNTCTGVSFITYSLVRYMESHGVEVGFFKDLLRSCVCGHQLAIWESNFQERYPGFV